MPPVIVLKQGTPRSKVAQVPRNSVTWLLEHYVPRLVPLLIDASLCLPQGQYIGTWYPLSVVYFGFTLTFAFGMDSRVYSYVVLLLPPTSVRGIRYVINNAASWGVPLSAVPAAARGAVPSRVIPPIRKATLWLCFQQRNLPGIQTDKTAVPNTRLELYFENGKKKRLPKRTVSTNESSALSLTQAAIPAPSSPALPGKHWYWM